MSRDIVTERFALIRGAVTAFDEEIVIPPDQNPWHYLLQSHVEYDQAEDRDKYLHIARDLFSNDLSPTAEEVTPITFHFLIRALNKAIFESNKSSGKFFLKLIWDITLKANCRNLFFGIIKSSEFVNTNAFFILVCALNTAASKKSSLLSCIIGLTSHILQEEPTSAHEKIIVKHGAFTTLDFLRHAINNVAPKKLECILQLLKKIEQQQVDANQNNYPLMSLLGRDEKNQNSHDQFLSFSWILMLSINSDRKNFLSWDVVFNIVTPFVLTPHQNSLFHNAAQSTEEFDPRNMLDLWAGIFLRELHEFSTGLNKNTLHAEQASKIFETVKSILTQKQDPRKIEKLLDNERQTFQPAQRFFYERMIIAGLRTFPASYAKQVAEENAAQMQAAASQ